MAKNKLVVQPLAVIKINGKQMPAWMYNCCTKISFKESDGNGALEELKIYFDDPEMQIMDSNIFKEKKTRIQCKMGYVNNKNCGNLFTGIVQMVENDYPESGGITLTITAYDSSYNMNEETKSKTWKGKTYSKIVQEICKKHGIIAIIDSTEDILKSKNAKVVQSKVSDLTFMKNLAKKAGYQFRFISSERKCYFTKTKTFKMKNTCTVDYKCGNQLLNTFKPSFNDYNKAMKYHSANINIRKKKVVSSKLGKISRIDNENERNFEPIVRGEIDNSEHESEFVSYTVKGNETLISLSKEFYGDINLVNKIYHANETTVKNGLNVLTKGTVLNIPI